MKKLLLVVLASLLSVGVFAQIKVTGKVTASNDGSPISFANVFVKGTTVGATTDDFGAYTIDNVGEDAVLMFSFIGYTTVEIPVNGRSVVDVALSPDAMSLDEVIMVAYGTAKKSSFTGAASVVKQDAIKDVPNVSFEQALNGKVAGLQVTTLSGQAGSTSSIRVRGIGSMNASNEPLYVIDGVPVTSGDASQMGSYIYTSNNVMSTLNPADIESMTVLKDAAASSLYGSRAANGVVMITTKKGKEGRPKVTFRASVGVTPDFATYNMDQADNDKQVEMYYEMFWNSYKLDIDSDGKHIPGTASDEYASDKALAQLNKRFNKHGYRFEAPDHTANSLKVIGMDDGVENRDGKYYDWEDALFRTAVFQTYDLSVSGAKNDSNYYTSLSYTKQQGVSTQNDFSRISGRVNLSQRVAKIIQFSTNVSLSKSEKTGFNDTYNNSNNYFMNSRNHLWDMYWPTDYETGDPWTSRYGSYSYNANYYVNEQENISRTTKLTASETISVDLYDGLVAKSVLSYDYTHVRDHVYYSANHYNAGTDEDGNAVAEVHEMSSTLQKLVSSSTLNYDKTFDKHSVGALVGFEAEKNNTDFIRASGSNLPTSSLTTVSTAGKMDANGYYWGNSMMSVLSRLEYNFDDRYFVSGSFRRDGSSKLGPESRWGNFWSVAGSWNIINEDFMKSQNILSNLRLRASYGVNGTLPPSNFGWRSLTSYTSKYQEKPGGGIANVADANLSWEKSYTTNVGVEFGLFEQKLRGSVEFFNRDSKDLLQSVPISKVTGFSSTLKNVGEVNNKGVEFDISGDIVRNSEVTWSLGVTGAWVDSKVTELYGNQDIIWYDPTAGDDRAKYIYREGENMLSFWGREWAGVDRETGQSLWYINDPDGNVAGSMMKDGRSVSYDYEDANEKIIGTATPKLYGGVNTDVTWKGVTLALNFIYKLGGSTYNATAKDCNDGGYFWERTMSEWTYDNRWTPENKDARYPQRIAWDLVDVRQYSTYNMNSGTFLRLKDINLSYNFPKKMINKIKCQNLRVYFNGSNLLTFAAHKEYDPEVNEFGTRGWEMPLGKTYTFGLEFTF